MTSQHITHKRARAFTLVELLVVIGIIALLISILLPTLARARDSAKAVKCGSNARQVVQGLIGYSTDFQGTLPLGFAYLGPGASTASGTKCRIAFSSPPPTARRTCSMVGSGNPSWGRVCT